MHMSDATSGQHTCSTTSTLLSTFGDVDWRLDPHELIRRKNFSLLIKALAQVRLARALRLVVIGDRTGAELAKLPALTSSLGPRSANVRIAGHGSNPLKFLANAGLFVLSSNWEGVSSVLLEALACGRLIVITDCPTGVRELLDDGWIAPIVPIGDVSAMAQAMLAKVPNHEYLPPAKRPSLTGKGPCAPILPFSRRKWRRRKP
jgi:glycosyltransferase involved in cell wall biosynthesis